MNTLILEIIKVGLDSEKRTEILLLADKLSEKCTANFFNLTQRIDNLIDNHADTLSVIDNKLNDLDGAIDDIEKTVKKVKK